jgi:endoribonuclease Dicer
MTPQILLQALEHAFLSLNQVSLMVYDEVHNAVKDHPYATLMKSYYRLLDTEYRPRVLGLTASPIHSSRPAMEAIRYRSLLY